MPKSSTKFRLIIDSNLWISFLISDKQRKLDRLLLLDQVKILFSVKLLDELTKIVEYPKLKSYFKPDAIEEMLLNLEPYIELIEIKSNVQICRDPKDDFLLNLAKDGKAHFLLTGDKDLLVLKKIGKTKIISIKEFLEKIML